ncbi:MAG: DUF1572 domain-containing protein [Firmicutes bacterium]|nr:DUF1572 domain-containing protein [Bacillota bacterium]
MMPDDAGARWAATALAVVDGLERRLTAAIAPLDPEDLGWRPNEESNSIANLVLHLRGNLRQRFLAGFGGEADDRDRAAEFADRSHPPASVLLERLREGFSPLRATLERVQKDPSLLDARRTIQGEEATLRDTLVRALAHTSEHGGQILYIAKARRGALHLD